MARWGWGTAGKMVVVGHQGGTPDRGWDGVPETGWGSRQGWGSSNVVGYQTGMVGYQTSGGMPDAVGGIPDAGDGIPDAVGFQTWDDGVPDRG